MTGLSPETKYTIKVRPVIGDVIMWSSSITFTTEAQRQAPKNLTVSDITATSALVSWEGSAKSYNVRYGLVPESSSMPEWLKYDDDNNTKMTAYGFNLLETTWGVMYPGSMVNGNKLTKIAIYETVHIFRAPIIRIEGTGIDYVSNIYKRVFPYTCDR